MTLSAIPSSGLTIGHEPDSLEFSSLGGWIATRASGMKRSTYGNIEDILVRVKMVTSVGTIDRKVDVPRLSMGPDVQQLVLGSEGILCPSLAWARQLALCRVVLALDCVVLLVR